MKHEDQKKFVNDLISSIRDEIYAEIDTGKVPEAWDGIELRWLLKNKFAAVVWKNIGSIRRKRDFNNHCLTVGIK